jgi:hypothetical protein
VLHTQEAWGSSPCAPTIRINNLPTILLTSYASRRRSEGQRPGRIRGLDALANNGNANISAQNSALPTDD